MIYFWMRPFGTSKLKILLLPFSVLHFLFWKSVHVFSFWLTVFSNFENLFAVIVDHINVYIIYGSIRIFGSIKGNYPRHGTRFTTSDISRFDGYDPNGYVINICFHSTWLNSSPLKNSFLLKYLKINKINISSA